MMYLIDRLALTEFIVETKCASHYKSQSTSYINYNFSHSP